MSSTYNNTKELRFWCQKVLPLVYDDSLSYYELLNKIVVYLNSTIEDVQAMIADVTRIEQGLSSKIDLTQKGVPNGVATLNAQGQVPLTQLPDISAGVQTISVNGVNVPADANKNVNIIVMTNAVSNLVNYYLKSETYNKTEVNALIDGVKNSRFEVVAQLPTTNIQTNVIYLVPKSVGQTQNGYDEFINLDGTTSGWELIGSTDIDLSGYVTDSELATALSAYVTTQSLNTTLAGYVTSGALATTLEGYVTQLSFQSLQSTVTSQGNTLAGLITTVNGKVDKVTGKGLSTNDYSNVDKAIVDNVTSALAGKFPRSEQRVLGAKNLFPIKLCTLKTNNTTGTWVDNVYSLNNTIITCTVENDYVTEITVNNENAISQNINFILFNGSNTGDLVNSLKGKELTLNGCPQNGSQSSYRMLFSTWNSVESQYDTGNGCTVDVPNDVAGLRFDIIIYSGYTPNNLKFYPMIRLATDPDATYIPYVMTNKELTEKATTKEYNYNANNVNSKISNLDTGKAYKYGNIIHVLVKFTVGETAISPWEDLFEIPNIKDLGKDLTIPIYNHSTTDGQIKKGGVYMSNNKPVIRTSATFLANTTYSFDFMYIIS